MNLSEAKHPAVIALKETTRRAQTVFKHLEYKLAAAVLTSAEYQGK